MDYYGNCRYLFVKLGSLTVEYNWLSIMSMMSMVLWWEEHTTLDDVYKSHIDVTDY